MSRINCILKTRENSSMSLSCVGEMKIVNGIVEYSSWHGYPRTNGKDSWIRYYESVNTGDKITQELIDNILSCDGHNNVISYIKNTKEK